MESKYEITMVENEAILPVEVSIKIAAVIRAKKAAEEEEKKMRESLQAAMEKYGVLSINNEYVSITRKEETTRETFDAKALKADNPDLYDEYVKFSPVKGSLLIKAK